VVTGAPAPLASEHEAERLQDAVDAMCGELSGQPVGRVAAEIATDSRLRPILTVPAFVEWIAAEISGGRRPTIMHRHDTDLSARDGGWGWRPRLRVSGPPSAATDSDATWTSRIDRVLDTGRVDAFLQPIVDLRTRIVVGYEALARFPESPARPTEHWFRHAAARGRLDELEAVAVRAALARLPECPRGCFLAVNVSPGALNSDPVQHALWEHRDLHGVVIELTAAAAHEDLDDLARRVDTLRAAGSGIAVTYTTGRTTERELHALRPSLVKLAEPFISRSRRESGDEQTEAALARIAGPFGTRLLVQNVEHARDLTGLERVGIKMVQGFVVGVPTSTWYPLANTVDVTTPVPRAPSTANTLDRAVRDRR
jgi:EAL domain-containing protein (putative c-di-GMP-specific phosphodiesterase class I)